MNAQHTLIDGLIAHLESTGVTVELRETHISWVLLVNSQALKIKKAVNFGFLDFSSLRKRKQACEEELRLNKRFAPQLYVDLAAIVGTPEQPRLEGDGQAIEYAVRMRRFDETRLLSHLAAKRQLTKVQIERTAARIAEFHLRAPVAPADNEWGRPEQVHKWLDESLSHIRRLVESGSHQVQIERIDQLCSDLYQAVRPTLVTRNKAGYIRECHGDLHLGNMIWLNEQLVPFDCIEFNPGLRWIDVISEAAFVMMDLEDRGYPAYAWVFVNHYLASTGDYPGLAVLRYYLVYRALVRAKVTLLQRDDPDTPAGDKSTLLDSYEVYAGIAERWLLQNRASLLIMHGLSASGKSTVARQVAEKHGCVHLRSDVERKRLHGLETLQHSHSQVGTGIYSHSASEQTYQHLLSCAATALNQGYPVIVDAAFLQRARREQFRQLASDLGCPFLIIHCEADHGTLRKRLIARAEQGRDPSEATLAVLQQQIASGDTLLDTEPVFRVTNTHEFELPALVADKIKG